MIFTSLSQLSFIALASASPAIEQRAKPAAVFLAGDSTTAPDGGWGNSFLSTLVSGASGTNFAVMGATTASFKADGYWAEVLAAVKRSRSIYSPYVTVQVR